MKKVQINRVRLGLNIRRHRRYIQRMTQVQLAEKIGCSVQMISALEQGKRELSVEMLLRLCYALTCTPEDLLKEIERDKKNP